MKILKEDSPLYMLPLEINDYQFLIFDAIRTSIEIIDLNYYELRKSLKLISNEIEVNKVSLFNNIWSIIDYTDRVKGLVSKLKLEGIKEIIKEFYPIRDFRNTIQHIDNRAEMVLNKNTPLFGYLIWFHKDLVTKSITPFVLFSGIAKIDYKVSFRIPDLDNSKDEINKITLRSYSDGTIQNIDTSEIINSLKKLIDILENKLQTFCIKNNYKMLCWKKRQNIIVKLQSED